MRSAYGLPDNVSLARRASLRSVAPTCCHSGSSPIWIASHASAGSCSPRWLTMISSNSSPPIVWSPLGRPTMLKPAPLAVTTAVSNVPPPRSYTTTNAPWATPTSPAKESAAATGSGTSAGLMSSAFAAASSRRLRRGRFHVAGWVRRTSEGGLPIWRTDSVYTCFSRAATRLTTWYGRPSSTTGAWSPRRFLIARSVLSGWVPERSSAVRPTMIEPFGSTITTDGIRRSPPTSITSGERSPIFEAATV